MSPTFTFSPKTGNTTWKWWFKKRSTNTCNEPCGSIRTRFEARIPAVVEEAAEEEIKVAAEEAGWTTRKRGQLRRTILTAFVNMTTTFFQEFVNICRDAGTVGSVEKGIKLRLMQHHRNQSAREGRRKRSIFLRNNFPSKWLVRGGRGGWPWCWTRYVSVSAFTLFSLKF